ncbi:MAG: sulfotransferase [Myxococcales bacterium]|nr:sulfotransferase [Myxococcales bacterium]
MQDRLVFVISPPRAGSTLLQRMLGAHSAVFTHPEPHLITPLAFLGYHDTVDAAPYDHVNAAEAIRSFVAGLPRGEEDYLDALRAYADTMYGRMLATAPDKSRFLDKTPAYALVWRFLTKLYPEAKYIVLTRHPLAVFSSYAQSFFEGDWREAHRYNPVVERYVPAMAELIRERPVPVCHVGYEELVQAPEKELERVFAFLGLDNEPDAVNYGRTEMKAGMGDPINVDKHQRPTTASLHKWAAELAHDERKLALARDMIARLSDEDLETWRWPRAAIFDALEGASDKKAPVPVRNDYTLQRRVMLALRKGVHARPKNVELVRRVRYYCDVLLRDRLDAR